MCSKLTALLYLHRTCLFGQGRSVGRFLGVRPHRVAPRGGEGGLGGRQGIRPLHGDIFGHVVDYGKPETDNFENVNKLVILVVTSGGRDLCHCPF